VEAIRIIGISLGSSRRDFRARLCFSGVQYEIERYGTDGIVEEAVNLIRGLDGKAGAIGLGGVNLAYILGKRQYPIKEGKSLAQAARITPVVDGAFVKQEWETRLIRRLVESGRLDLQGKQVLLSSALDRYHLGLCLEQLGARVWVGDALLALKLPILFPSVASFALAGTVAMPMLALLPLKFLYPLGKKQEIRKRGWSFLLQHIDIFAGDFHLINRYLPVNLKDKGFITSTLTEEDRHELSLRGAGKVFPLGLTIAGRSCGANILDALITAAAAKGVYGTQSKIEVVERILDSYLKTFERRN
jgi:hypothetical protein